MWASLSASPEARVAVIRAPSISCLGFGVQGLGFRVEGLGVWGSRFKVLGLGFGVEGFILS